MKKGLSMRRLAQRAGDARDADLTAAGAGLVDRGDDSLAAAH